MQMQYGAAVGVHTAHVPRLVVVFATWLLCSRTFVVYSNVHRRKVYPSNGFRHLGEPGRLKPTMKTGRTTIKKVCCEWGAEECLI